MEWKFGPTSRSGELMSANGGDEELDAQRVEVAAETDRSPFISGRRAALVGFLQPHVDGIADDEVKQLLLRERLDVTVDNGRRRRQNERAVSDTRCR